ncbi:MAG: PQQ-binding-like beta-propeller repeat protein [Phycisphaerae bacterium]|jgi:outer membrane protein assembly factor BamB|nr:PQQ-binding-like beta-propeller repeat protein [Phycisphaerae bacterium]
MKSLSIVLVLSLFCSTLPAAKGGGATAAKVIAASDVRGGLVVIIGSNAQLAAEMGKKPSYMVHMIDTDPARVDSARKHIQSKGLYGKVSVDRFDGIHLPYVDNLVNLVVDERAEVKGRDTKDLSKEITRVLAPRGVFLSESKGQWTAHRKPVPKNIDDWTHFLHGPDNNAVALDSVVGPPRHMQWVGGPRYGRHHDKMSSLSAAVSAKGRVFYIKDEAPPFSVLTAPEWRLVARDAFNGTILWKRKITKWFNDLHMYKGGPANLPRKLVASGDRVYVTLSIDGPAMALNAASGETVRTYKGTEPADELVYAGGMLFVRKKENGLVALDAVSGKELWKTDRAPVRGSLAVDSERAAFLAGDRIVCLNRKDGKELWRSKPVPRPEKYHIRFNPILILYADVVLFVGGEKSVGHKDSQGNYSWAVGKNDTINALSAKTGEVLWTAPHPLSGYASSEDLFVIDGVVWCGETTSGHAVGHFAGRDVKTGKIVKEFDPDVKTYWFHHRCYRGKATEKYILTSRTGLEYIDPKTGKWQINHWVRGACLYGVMPANGLIYAPQNPCACFLENRMVGFSALASARAPVAKSSRAARLETPPNYVKRMASVVIRPGDSWPTYRGNNARSGSTKTLVPAQLKPAWTTRIGGKLSSPTIAVGRVFLASIDRHQVFALNQKDGRIVWQHTAGARVDSPPTIWAGPTEGGPPLCIFGSRDGTITALRASDGVLAWRFRAAPIDRRVMAFEQLESAWPVSGSVLIHQNVLYAVAGRSLFLDGGLRLLRLDPTSGKLLSETIMNDKDDKGDDIHKYARQHNMPVSLPDILSCNGKHIFMRSQAFKLDGTRLPLKALKYGGNPERYSIKPTQDPEQAHLFSPTGFLDDSWWHRTYWMYGSRFIGGWAGYPQAGRVAPAGRILVFDSEKVFGFGRHNKYYRWTKPIEHHLFAAKKTGYKSRLAASFSWKRNIGMFPRGMVKAGKLLFIAGPIDSVDENKALRQRNTPVWREKIRLQAEAYAGRSGGLLRAISTATGEQVSELKTDSIPVFDGLAAANGKLYVSLVDGRIICFGDSGSNQNSK